MCAASNFKGQTAGIIFTAFIFRLFFLSVYVLAPQQTSRIENLPGADLSFVVKKRRRDNEAVEKLTTTKYTSADVFDENSDEDKNLLFKRTTFPEHITGSFFSISKVSIPFIRSFDTIKSNLYPGKHIAFSIFRI